MKSYWLDNNKPTLTNFWGRRVAIAQLLSSPPDKFWLFDNGSYAIQEGRIRGGEFSLQHEMMPLSPVTTTRHLQIWRPPNYPSQTFLILPPTWHSNQPVTSHKRQKFGRAGTGMTTGFPLRSMACTNSPTYLWSWRYVRLAQKSKERY